MAAIVQQNSVTASDLEAVARGLWDSSKEDTTFRRAIRDERGRVVRSGTGRQNVHTEAVTQRKMPKWTCPHCGQESRPAYAGYILWAGGDEAPEGIGLYMTVKARCYWSQQAILNINALSPKGKHMKAWRPHHAQMQPCGEEYDFETVKVLDF